MFITHNYNHIMKLLSQKEQSYQLAQSPWIMAICSVGILKVSYKISSPSITLQLEHKNII